MNRNLTTQECLEILDSLPRGYIVGYIINLEQTINRAAQALGAPERESIFRPRPEPEHEPAPGWGLV